MIQHDRADPLLRLSSAPDRSTRTLDYSGLIRSKSVCKKGKLGGDGE